MAGFGKLENLYFHADILDKEYQDQRCKFIKRRNYHGAKFGVIICDGLGKSPMTFNVVIIIPWFFMNP